MGKNVYSESEWMIYSGEFNLFSQYIQILANESGLGVARPGLLASLGTLSPPDFGNIEKDRLCLHFFRFLCFRLFLMKALFLLLNLGSGEISWCEPESGILNRKNGVKCRKMSESRDFNRIINIFIQTPFVLRFVSFWIKLC